MTHLLPDRLCYLKVFSGRQVWQRDARGNYTFRAEESDPDLEAQAKAWVDRERVLLCGPPGPPSLVVSEEGDYRVYHVSVAVLYLLPSEGTDDELATKAQP